MLVLTCGGKSLICFRLLPLRAPAALARAVSDGHARSAMAGSSSEGLRKEAQCIDPTVGDTVGT